MMIIISCIVILDVAPAFTATKLPKAQPHYKV